MPKLTIISSAQNWLEQSAIDQLHHTLALPGVINAVGLPDLHPGKTPVGAVITTDGILYPHLVGNDIGCGMSFFTTNLEIRKLNLERLARKTESLSSLKEIPLPADNAFFCSPLGDNLGTIGGGNHFAELQEAAAIFDKEEFNKLGFDKNQVMLLVHSGSRSYGETILDESIRIHQAQNGLLHTTTAAQQYLTHHDNAVKWAAVNRQLIAVRLLQALGLSTQTNCLVDCAHNYVSVKQLGHKQVFLHRKGAAPGDQGAIVIPGSRGALTYLVKPTAHTEASAYSLAHGAGRKWQRSLCRGRLENKYTKESIKHTKLKSRVICHDSKLLFEEAPEAYKNIDTVIQSLIDFNLIDIIATFKPLLTYKA
ncbi:MAG: ligase RtcB family protein [Firmicutes bacterium]|nr:ligase RtcB family protein [Bacillota bacterium]